MNDRARIGIGLALFIVLVTFPIWRAFGVATPAPPELTKARAGSRCVEDPAWMRANHPQLLDGWRLAVVREGRSVYVSADGGQHDMGLTGNCLGCHGKHEAFCDRCHTYADVQLTCWNCHQDSKTGDVAQ